MKELSIEEKAKAYDEAIERARIWKDKSGMPKDKRGILDEIFPELRESEDERIVKCLLNYFNHVCYNGLDLKGTDVDEVIAWLEKQGGQKLNPVLDIEIPLGAKDSELQEASYYIPEGFHAEIEGNRVIIKKGEQKPTEEYNITGIKSKHAQGKLGEMIKKLEIEKQSEQKPIKEHNACEFCEDRYGCVSPCSMKLV